MLVTLGRFLCVLGCFCRQAQPILERKIPSNNKPLREQAPPKISPAKKPFEQIYAQGLLSEFYGIKCYRHNKYEPNVFSGIFRHKQPQNVDLKQLALLK